MRTMIVWVAAVLLVGAVGCAQQAPAASQPVREVTVVVVATATPEPARESTVTPVPIPPTTMPTAEPVHDPFTDEWRTQNLAFAEAIATKIALIDTTAAAIVAGELTFQESHSPFLSGLAYVLDAQKYHLFLLQAAEKNLKLSQNELDAIGVLREITKEDGGACIKAIDLMNIASSSGDPASWRLFSHVWHADCSEPAQESLKTLQQ